MKIGIDLGGSHIACGLIDNGRILIKKERDFLNEDKPKIKNVITQTIITYIEDILRETKMKIEEIESIGIAAPGTHKDGVIVKAENLGITNFNLIRRIKKAL